MKRVLTAVAVLAGAVAQARADAPSVSVADAVVSEGSGTASFAVTLRGDATLPVTVDWATQDLTAASGSDYVAGAGTLSFQAVGQTLQIDVPILADGTPESTETFYLRLTSATNAAIPALPAHGVIQDDDFGPRRPGKCDLEGGKILVQKVGEGDQGDPGGGASCPHDPWRVSGTVVDRPQAVTLDGWDWHVGATGDFDGDGACDLVWTKTVNQQLERVAVTITPASHQFQTPGDPGARFLESPGPAWALVGSGDFTGDGAPDLLWHEASGAEASGWLAVWPSDGAGNFPLDQRRTLEGPGTNWKAVAVADLRGDGSPEIVWRNSVSGKLIYWEMAGLSHTGGGFLSPDTLPAGTWEVRGAADFNSDGSEDLLLQNRDSYRAVVWFMNGPTRVVGTFLSPDGFAGAGLIVGPR